MIQRFLEGNQRFVEQTFGKAGGYFSELAKAQSPSLLWIGCADSRVSELAVTDSRPGEIFVHRNVANIVAFNDTNIAAVLEYGIKHLRIPDIVVCGHYGCGGIQALDQDIDDPFLEDWLLVARGARERVNAIEGLSPEQRHRQLVQENVRLQLKHLAATGVVRRAREQGEGPRLHGWVYDLQTGELEVIESGGLTNRDLSGQ